VASDVLKWAESTVENDKALSIKKILHIVCHFKSIQDIYVTYQKHVESQLKYADSLKGTKRVSVMIDLLPFCFGDKRAIL
jgi:hypothetical protein